MTDFELTCSWLETCGRPSAGMAAHPVQGVIPVCASCQANFNVPLIQPRKVG